MKTSIRRSEEHAIASLREIDSVLGRAGLVRSRRGKAMPLRPRLDDATPEGLTRLANAPKTAPSGVVWLPVPGWEEFGWLWHGFSTRKGGLTRAYCSEDAPSELNLGLTEVDKREIVLQNRRLLAEAITGNPDTPIVVVRQFHSSLIGRVHAEDAVRERPARGDGHITDEAGFLLAIQTADCIPVLIADRKRRAIGAFHAGWRGTVQRIVETGLGRMRVEFDCRPEDLTAAIGPGIGACCYAVGEDVISAFESQFSYARELLREVYDTDPVRMKYPMLFLTQRAPGHSPIGPQIHLDLIEANRRQLLDAGIAANSIQVLGGCTNCQPELFFSHRGSHGHAGRMMSVIGVRTAI